MRQHLPRIAAGAAGLAGCALLAACAPQYEAAPAGDLNQARLACNAEYPRRLGNYLPHAQCVNAAVERYAMPTARYPDLIRLQERVRAALSRQVDRRRLSVNRGEARMRHADALVAEAERERNAGRQQAAERKVAAMEEMLR